MHNRKFNRNHTVKHNHNHNHNLNHSQMTYFCSWFPFLGAGTVEN